MRDLKTWIDNNKYGELATIIGRYYAMDRDKRWERTCIAYELYVSGKGEKCIDPIQVLNRHNELLIALHCI